MNINLVFSEACDQNDHTLLPYNCLNFYYTQFPKILEEIKGYEDYDIIISNVESFMRFLQETPSKWLDFLIFLNVITKRLRKYLDHIIQYKGLSDIESENKKYTPDFVYAWASNKVLVEKWRRYGVLSITDFNEQNPFFLVEKFSWWMLVESEEDMLNDTNYIKSEVFSLKDYVMVVDNYIEAYWHIDQWLLLIYIRNLAKDLNNSSASFYLMRDKQTGRILSICKTRETQEGELLLWTNYVEPECRADFWFWSYLIDLAVSDNDEIENIYWIVAINNTSLSVHINHWKFVADRIIREEDAYSYSKEWMRVVLDKKNNFRTRDKNKYSDETIKSMVWHPTDGISIYLLDTSFGCEGDFISLCKEYFDKWYRITRLFYESYGKKQNLWHTYVVFEELS